jgi:hypothetical protein
LGAVILMIIYLDVKTFRWLNHLTLFCFEVLEQRLPPQAAGNFLLNGKKSPKNVSLLFSESVVRRQHVRAAGCGPRASLRAITVASSWEVTGIKLLVNDHRTPCSRGRLKQEKENDLALKPHRPWLRAVQSFKKLDTGHA